VHAARAGGIAAVEALEQSGQGGARDPGPLVGHRNPRLLAEVGDLHHDLTANGRVLHGVAEEIVEDLADAITVPGSWEWSSGEVQAHGASGVRRLGSRDAGLDQLKQM